MIETQIQKKTVQILKSLPKANPKELFTPSNLLSILKASFLNLNFSSCDLVIQYLKNTEQNRTLQSRKLAAIEIEDYEDAIICRDTQKSLKKEVSTLKV